MTSVPSRLIYFVFGSFLITLFSGGMIISVFILCCIYIIYSSRHFLSLQKQVRPEILALIFFSIWVSISYFWSISPENSMETMLKFGLINILGMTAIAGLIQNNLKTKNVLNDNLLLALLVLISLILIAEHVTNYKFAIFLRNTFNFDRYNYGQPMDHATALYSLLLPFSLYYFWDKKIHLSILIILSVIVFVFHPMFAAMLAVLLASLLSIILTFLNKRWHMPFSILTVIFVFFMPQIMSLVLGLDTLQAIESIPSSWQERIDIWNKSIILINENPVMGWGLDTSSSIEKVLNNSLTGVIQVHPHNIPLQIRLESGIVGISLFCVFVGLVWRKILQQQDRLFFTACVASICIYFVFAIVSFNAWHSWWLCTQYLAVIVIISFQKICSDKTQRPIDL
jgi:O-antigen ligase